MVYLEESYPGKGQPGQFLGAQERTRSIVPVKSLVQVYFAEHNRKLTYYNDRFDLREGDFVFVSGALERQRGIVCHVRTGFRVKVSDYEKVISVADTAVSGRLHMMLSHMVTFDPHTLPYEKVRTWYLPPINEDEEYATGTDDSVYSLRHPERMDVSSAVFDRGANYYEQCRVCWLCVDKGHGRAIVEGTHIYEVEFELDGDLVRNLVCDCPCGYHCKHEVAVMLQLRETLDLLEKYFPERQGDYFAAVSKKALFSFVFGCKIPGSLTLELQGGYEA